MTDLIVIVLLKIGHFRAQLAIKYNIFGIHNCN